MKLDIIRIGDARVVRLPKAALEQVGAVDAVDMSVEGARIILSPVSKEARAGWDAAFAGAASSDDPARWPHGSTSAFDEQEWTW